MERLQAMATQLQLRIQRTNPAGNLTAYVPHYILVPFALKFPPGFRGPWRVSYICDCTATYTESNQKARDQLVTCPLCIYGDCSSPFAVCTPRKVGDSSTVPSALLAGGHPFG